MYFSRIIFWRHLNLMSLDRSFVSVVAVIFATLAESPGRQFVLAIIALACIAGTPLLCLFSPILRKIN